MACLIELIVGQASDCQFSVYGQRVMRHCVKLAKSTLACILKRDFVNQKVFWEQTPFKTTRFFFFLFLAPVRF